MRRFSEAMSLGLIEAVIERHGCSITENKFSEAMSLGLIEAGFSDFGLRSKLVVLRGDEPRPH